MVKSKYHSDPNEHSDEARKFYFTSLDSLRGLSAVIVVLLHLTAVGYIYDIPVIRHGALAVPLFFVLSGFVICHSAWGRLRTKGDMRRFMLRRIGRVYPLHLLTLGILVALELAKLWLVRHGVGSGQAPFTGSDSPQSLVANIFLLQAIIPFGYTSWNVVAWSVSVEFYTYVVFALVVLASGTRPVVGIIVSLCVASALIIFSEAVNLDLNDGGGFVTCLFGFFGGATIYLLRERTGKPIAPTPLLEIVATAITVALFWYQPFGSAGTIVCFCFVVYSFSFDASFISKVLSTFILQILGKLSFSIYLIHYVVIATFFGFIRVLERKLGVPMIYHLPDKDRDLLQFGSKIEMDAVVIVLLLLSLGLALISYRLFESPCRKYFNLVSDGEGWGEAARVFSFRKKPAGKPITTS